MRWGAALLTICACNQIYELEPTRLPPPDAPYACPPLGGAAPEFSTSVYQASTQIVASYHFTPTGSLAVAAAFDGLYLGRLGEPLVRSKDIIPAPGHYFSDAHPSPDGDRLYIQVLNETTQFHAGQLAIFERAGDSWRAAGEVPADVAIAGNPSTVFRGPIGDRIIFSGSTVLVEYEHTGDTWMPRGEPHARADLEIDAGATLVLTSDGLRAVFRGGDNAQMFYTDRPDLDSWFRAPQPLTGVPRVADAQLTDDCARIYYSGFGTVFYSTR